MTIQKYSYKVCRTKSTSCFPRKSARTVSWQQPHPSALRKVPYHVYQVLILHLVNPGRKFDTPVPCPLAATARPYAVSWSGKIAIEETRSKCQSLARHYNVVNPIKAHTLNGCLFWIFQVSHLKMHFSRAGFSHALISSLACEHAVASASCNWLVWLPSATLALKVRTNSLKSLKSM